MDMDTKKGSTSRPIAGGEEYCRETSKFSFWGGGLPGSALLCWTGLNYPMQLVAWLFVLITWKQIQQGKDSLFFTGVVSYFYKYTYLLCGFHGMSKSRV